MGLSFLSGSKVRAKPPSTALLESAGASVAGAGTRWGKRLGPHASGLEPAGPHRTLPGDPVRRPARSQAVPAFPVPTSVPSVLICRPLTQLGVRQADLVRADSESTLEFSSE